MLLDFEVMFMLAFMSGVSTIAIRDRRGIIRTISETQNTLPLTMIDKSKGYAVRIWH